jgi:hypothetical protein
MPIAPTRPAHSTVSTQHPADARARTPPLSAQPSFPGTTNYTNYKTNDPARVRDEVMRVTDNGSFISRSLRVLSVDGQSKNFETITGQDGLTFGITDFATDGAISGFAKMLNKNYPDKFREAFGANGAHLLDDAWVHANNAGGHGQAANDNGLVKFPWLREGLSKILCDRTLHGLQLEYFSQGKVVPSLKTFQEHKLTLEYSLGAMIGIANSAGHGGMEKYLDAAELKATGSGVEREKSVTREMIRSYVLGDPHLKPNDKDFLLKSFGEKSGPLPAVATLGHRAKRAAQIFENFPPGKNVPFTQLGDFALQADEKMPKTGWVR